MYMKNVAFSKRDTNIIKGMAICAMVFHHCFLSEDRFTPFNVSTFPFTDNQLVMIALAGKVCVAVFTFLSAYGMTISYKSKYPDFQYTKEATVPVIWKRLMNLLGGFWICYTAAFILSYLVPCSSKPHVRYFGKNGMIKGSINVFLDFLGLSDIFGTPSICGTWWYMALAIELICIMPLLLKLYRICGIALYPIVITVIHLFEMPLGNNLQRYMPVIILGIWFADLDLLAKIRERISGKKKYPAALVFLLGFVLVSAVLSLNYKNRTEIILIADSIQAICFILFGYLAFSEMKVVSDVFYFMGTHSMNIFLLHSLFRDRFWAGHVYRTGHFILTFLLLLGEALLVSVILEALKSVLHYKKLISWLQKAPFEKRKEA